VDIDGFRFFGFLVMFVSSWTILTRGVKWGEGFKISVTRVLGGFKGYRYFEVKPWIYRF
jgi:hypothetical protein